MFVELAPQHTGVISENSYDDPTMWVENYASFALGSVGTGVSIGDYDDDGRPDIFVVNKTDSCRLFRNLGNWKFEDVTIKAGVSDRGGDALIWKQGASFVDVNNDGLLDLYVCRFNAPNLLYINQGNGTFNEEAEARGLALKDASVMGAFGDYDRDGWLDVFVQTNQPESIGHRYEQKNHLFHNKGDGMFAEVTAHAGIGGKAQGHSAVWWDYDNDGWPDLYVGNDFTPTDKLYHNNRDGTFTDVIDRVVPHTPFSSMGLDLGDVNNDGLIDLFVADMAATTHQKDQRTMANVRILIKDPPENREAAPFLMRNALYLNTGTGRCLEAACLAGLDATDWTWSARFEDLDNDGHLDLHVTNGMYREPHNADLMARIAAAESLVEKVRLERASPMLAEPNLAFRNLGDLKFQNVSAAWGLGQKGVSFGTAFGDLDDDGDLDLVYTNYKNSVTVLRNDSDTGHRVIFALRGTQSNRFGVGTTVRIETASGMQVRQLTLARGYLSGSEPVMHFGLGQDTIIKQVTVSWPSGQSQIFSDIDADRKLTITEPPAPVLLSTEAKTNTAGQFTEVGQFLNLALLSREMNDGEAGQGSLRPMRQNRRGPGLAVGDVNGDGRDDVIMGGSSLDPLRLMISDATGRFSAADLPALAAVGPLDDGPLLLLEADGDGHSDLLVTKGGEKMSATAVDYQPRLFLNDGHGEFRPAPAGILPSIPISAGAATAADFDRDGRLDVFIGARVSPGRYPLVPRSVLLANRGGKFEDVTDVIAPGLSGVGMVTSALWSDVDDDGWIDLLVAIEWGHVSYFHNTQGRGFEDWTGKAGFASAGTGWWSSLAAADFNGDGRPDYVAGNLGLNTQYLAEPAHPALLFSGDFKGDGGLQLVEAYYEGDRIFPWRTRKDLGAAIPLVIQRYARTDYYAKASLGEILGENKLAAADRIAATELRSGVYLSQSDGTFHFEPLPRIAQIGPIQGLVAGDFDGDGNADIYAAQNSYAPIPSVGRFDGGLSQLLRGDGHGHFTDVPAGESGLVVPGDAKALAILDIDRDGWPDFLVTRNNSVSFAWRNQGRAGRHSLSVKLRGPTLNPTGAGARITVEFLDGSTQTNELQVGSGYYSQSASTCFFGWTDDNPPRKVIVRWPAGFITHYVVPPQTVTLSLDAP